MQSLTAARFCKANAETAHALSHWRYHLNQWVLDWLQAQGYTSAEKILQREKWSIRKKRDYANEVVDNMEQKGEIKALYRDFKHNLEAAREAKVSLQNQTYPENPSLHHPIAIAVQCEVTASTLARLEPLTLCATLYNRVVDVVAYTERRISDPPYTLLLEDTVAV